MSATLELPWVEFLLGRTHFEADPHAPPGSYVLEWHTAACTLYVVRGEQEAEVDLRLDSEVYEIRVCILTYLNSTLIHL
jgi:hypothetical protein